MQCRGGVPEWWRSFLMSISKYEADVLMRHCVDGAVTLEV